MRYRVIIKEQPDRHVDLEKLAKALLAAARARRDSDTAAPKRQEKAS